MVTTIMARPEDTTAVPVYCTFSGRALYSTYVKWVFQMEAFGLGDLVNVTLYDFLNCGAVTLYFICVTYPSTLV